MEVGLVGGDTDARLTGHGSPWRRNRIRRRLQGREEVDVVGVTKGKGWQGSIKRFGLKLLSHKNSKRRRQGGNMETLVLGYVRKTIRQAGQVGYHKRTELNKRILEFLSQVRPILLLLEDF